MTAGEVNRLSTAVLPLRARTAAVDETVAAAYRACLAPLFAKGVALVAVGGYGRRELFPYSDVDLLILCDKEISGDEQREALSRFLRSLWDSGMRLSQSVRTPAECCRLDSSNVELSISLIDRRFLAGDNPLYDQFRDRLRKFFRTERPALVGHLCQLTRERHAKYHNTIHHLEPDVKESPGGLRDLQVIRWLGRLRESSAEATAPLDAARDFLSTVRRGLHEKSGRDRNTLTFEMQEELASDPPAWMREYFRHAREIHRTVLRDLEDSEAELESGLFKSFREWRGRLSNSDFTVARERVFLRSPQAIATDPELVMRLFEFVARHGVRLSVETERRVREHTLYVAEYFASRRPLWPSLQRMLALPSASLALRAMHETGLLQVVFPAWESIECLVIRDFFHRYTVDEHTLVAIEYIEELRGTRDTSRRRFTDLLGEVPDVSLLYLALLFHDTGKSDGFEDHSTASTAAARAVLEQIRVPAADAETVLLLIERHLTLSAVMNSRDLADPATAVELAGRVGTVENLKYLTLVTYADISAVNPEAMTPWRLEQLWRTYLVAYRELTRELDTDRIEAPRDAVPAFADGFPRRYLRTHSGSEITEHADLVETATERGAALDLRRDHGFWRLAVATADRTGLLAAFAGVLAGFGMNIVKAEAFANRGGMVLDTFVFEDPMRTLELNPEEVERLRTVLKRAALGKEDVPKLLKGRAPVARVPDRARIRPAVAFDSEASASATLVEIVAQDRPGLLYDLARTFAEAGCAIEVVLLDTEAHKAIDVFYVTSNRAKLGAELQNRLKAELLAVCS